MMKKWGKKEILMKLGRLCKQLAASIDPGITEKKNAIVTPPK
jgi:hypothetical protein